MADTLVERVTGRAAAEPESVALNLVMSDQALLGQDNAPAVLDGYGPIPCRWRSAWCAMQWSMSGRWRIAAAVAASEGRIAGGDGVAVAVVSQGAGGVYRRAESDMSHPVL
jgi:hypothetical protein